MPHFSSPVAPTLSRGSEAGDPRQLRRGLFDDPTLAVPAVVALLGIVLFLSSFLTFGNSIEAMSWSATEGVVTRSEIGVRIGNKGHRSAEARIDVRYKVGGKSYTGHRITWKHPKPGNVNRHRYLAVENRGFIEDLVDRYPEGKRVEVWYSPKDPKNAVVENHLAWGSVAASLVGLVLFAGGLGGGLLLHAANAPPSLADAVVPTPRAPAPPVPGGDTDGAAEPDAEPVPDHYRGPRSWRKKG